MANDSIYIRVKRLIKDGDEALLEQLCDDAVDTLKAFTHRNELPAELERAAGDLAIVRYNRLGTEGETGRSEGGESYSFSDMPDHIFKLAKSYRKARIGGYENKTEQTDDSDD